jgi:hypothetical protein
MINIIIISLLLLGSLIPHHRVIGRYNNVTDAYVFQAGV